MERLTARNEADTAYYYPLCFEKCNGFGASEKCNKCELNVQACEKLGQYEDSEEQGLLLRLPCKVGTQVWKINECSGGGRIPNWCEIYKVSFALDLFFDFGKTVFLSKEEAEQALKQMGE